MHAQVAEAQDHHFSLTSAWLQRSQLVANELLALYDNKHQLETSIATQQTRIAELTLMENDSFKLPG